jgi:hypothetical protein
VVMIKKYQSIINRDIIKVATSLAESNTEYITVKVTFRKRLLGFIPYNKTESITIKGCSNTASTKADLLEKTHPILLSFTR